MFRSTALGWLDTKTQCVQNRNRGIHLLSHYFYLNPITNISSNHITTSTSIDSLKRYYNKPIQEWVQRKQLYASFHHSSQLSVKTSAAQSVQSLAPIRSPTSHAATDSAESASKQKAKATVPVQRAEPRLPRFNLVVQIYTLIAS